MLIVDELGGIDILVQLLIFHEDKVGVIIAVLNCLAISLRMPKNINNFINTP
jgi:hypothetical protein